MYSTWILKKSNIRSNQSIYIYLNATALVAKQKIDLNYKTGRWAPSLHGMSLSGLLFRIILSGGGRESIPPVLLFQFPLNFMSADVLFSFCIQYSFRDHQSQSYSAQINKQRGKHISYQMTVVQPESFVSLWGIILSYWSQFNIGNVCNQAMRHYFMHCKTSLTMAYRVVAVLEVRFISHGPLLLR